MANYSVSGHQLLFSANFKQIVVKSGVTTIATYDLDTAYQSISVAVTGTNYVLADTTDFDVPTHFFDPGGGDELAFNGTQIEGIIIIDVRDTNRLGGVEEGTYSFIYDLGCTTFRLKYVAGAFALKVYFEDEGCCSVEEARR